MIIDIDDELFFKVKELMKNNHKLIYEELEQIKPLNAISTLQLARDIKTQRIKQSIKETITNFLNENINPTKYKINRKTGISFITINKYYDEIIDEVLNGNK